MTTMWMCLSLLILLKIITVAPRVSNVLFAPLPWAGSHISKHMHYGTILASNGYNVSVICQTFEHDDKLYEKYRNKISIIKMNISSALVYERSRYHQFIRSFVNWPNLKYFFIHPFGFIYREICSEFYKRFIESKRLYDVRWDLIIVDDPYTSCWYGISVSTRTPMAVMSSSSGSGFQEFVGVPNNPSYVTFGLWMKDNSPGQFLWRLTNWMTTTVFKWGLLIMQSIQNRGLIPFGLGGTLESTEHVFFQKRSQAFFLNYPTSLDQTKPLSPTSTHICCDWSSRALSKRTTTGDNNHQTISSKVNGMTNITNSGETIVLATFGHGGILVKAAGAMLSAMNDMHDLKFIVQGSTLSDENIIDVLNITKILKPHIVVEMWVSQTEILNLDATKLFITHGGLGGIDEAIEAQVPMMVVPQDADQFANAINVQRSNLGINAVKMNVVDQKDWQIYITNALDITRDKNMSKLCQSVRSSAQFATRDFVWQVRRIIRQHKQTHYPSYKLNYKENSIHVLRLLSIFIGVGYLVIA